MSKKKLKFELEQVALPVDPLAASAQAYRDLMSSPEAPEWAKVSVNPAFVAAPDRVDVAARLAQLEIEQADALAKLAAVQEEQRAMLNQQLADQRAVEEQGAAAQALPNRLHEALKMVQSFTPTTESAPVPVQVDHIARGKEALARAMRRLHGEDVPEPVYDDAVAPVVPGDSAQQRVLRERVAPALELAKAMQAELSRWQAAVGKNLDGLYVGQEDDQRRAVDDLMRGVPPTQPPVALVTALLRSVRQLVDLKAGMQKTLSRETTALEHIVAGIDRRGSMEVSGDHSAAWYSLERELAGTLRDLGTVNPDAIAALWTGVNGVMTRLEALARIRAEHAGEAVPVLQWHNVSQILDEADAAKRTGEDVFGDGPGGRPHVGASWSVFDNNKETK